LGVIVVAVLLTAGLAFTVEPIAFDKLQDARVYIAMAEAPLANHPAPFSFRILVPILARSLPFDLTTSFRVLTMLFISGTGVLTYFTLRQMGMDRLLCFLGLISFYSLNWAARFACFDFRLTDPALFFFLSMCLLLVLKGRLRWAVLVMALGTLAKESMLFALPLVYGIRARKVIDMKVLAQTILMGLVPLSAYLIVRLNITASYHPVELLATIGRERLYSGLGALLRGGTVGTWGVELLILGVLSGREGWRWMLRVLPFLIVVYTQPLFAINVDRLLVLGFPAVIPWAMMGWKYLRKRFRLKPWMMIGYSCLPYLLLVTKERSSFNSPAPEKELLFLAGWTGLVLATRRSHGQRYDREPTVGRLGADSQN